LFTEGLVPIAEVGRYLSRAAPGRRILRTAVVRWALRALVVANFEEGGELVGTKIQEWA
jgi:hypothetical protein